MASLLSFAASRGHRAPDPARLAHSLTTTLEGERTISWIQNFRRLCIRYEKSTAMFQGFLHLGCTLLLLKQVLG
ncbi:MAG: hypothetical protein ACK4WH_12110 [Phycisphaerales bacterium]